MSAILFLIAAALVGFVGPIVIIRASRPYPRRDRLDGVGRGQR